VSNSLPRTKKRKRAYEQTPEAIQKRRVYDMVRNSRPDRKEKNRVRARERYSRPDVAARVRERNRERYSRPDVAARVRERNRERYSRPDVAARARERNNRPDIKAKTREYNRAYKMRPDVAARRADIAADVEAKRLEELMAWLHENGSTTEPFTRGSCSKIARKIYDAITVPVTGQTLRSDPTLRQAFDDPEFACYIGETGQLRLEEEDCGWLSKRGSLSSRGTNNPVLTWKSVTPGTIETIKRTEAFNQLGFRSMVVFRHASVAKCLLVESELQRLCHNTGLGRRLHRMVGAGMRYMPYAPPPDGSPRLHKVFITYSHDVARHLREGTIELHPDR